MKAMDYLLVKGSAAAAGRTLFEISEIASNAYWLADVPGLDPMWANNRRICILQRAERFAKDLQGLVDALNRLRVESTLEDGETAQ